MLFCEKQNYTCRYINCGLIFSPDKKIKLCCNDSYNAVIVNDFNGINFDSSALKEKIEKIRSEYIHSNNDNCSDCYNKVLSKKNKSDSFFDFVELNHWKSCFLNCVYCNDEKVIDLTSVNHYDITPVISEMFDKKLISKNTKIIFGCGDALLHPEFDKLMYFLINNDMKDIEIFTSAQRYCHSISEALDKKIAKLYISFDSGCPYIYERIKGFNKFDIAVNNLKRYIMYDDKYKGRVILTYKLVKGINDNKKEILDWFMMSRGFGIKKLYADIDENWYNELNGNPDVNIRELILFMNELAQLNCYDIEFSIRLNYMYKKITENHHVCI